MSNWERLVWNQRDALLSGLGVTLEICFLAFAGAIVGGSSSVLSGCTWRRCVRLRYC